MTWNPLDWTAGPFLAFYVAIAIILFSLGFSLRSALGPAMRATRQLTVLEMAYLAGGALRLGDTILLCLMSGGGATIAPKDHKITITDLTPLTTLLGRPSPPSFSPVMTRQQFQKEANPLTERTLGRLQEFGYCPTDDQMTSFRMTILPFVGLLLVLGGLKALVGSERGHSVGFLIGLLFVTTFVGFILAKRPLRTRAGNEVLRTYQTSHARASRAPLEHELLLAVALSGAVILSGTGYASVYAASQTMSSSGGGDSGGGGCGGGGGGCGGCS